jgi:hypothetical protein
MQIGRLATRCTCADPPPLPRHLNLISSTLDPQLSDDTSQRALLKLFAPLAMSGIFFPLARPVINAAIARSDDPATALAAYSVLFSLTIPLLSPLFGLRQIVTSLAIDRDMIRRLGIITLTLSGIATVPLIFAAVPAVYMWLTIEIVGVPEEIARIGPPAMLVLTTAPIISVARGYYQGILVKYGRANAIGFGALLYLVVSVAIAFPLISIFHVEGALAATIAFTLGSMAYAFIVWLPYRKVWNELIPEKDETLEDEKRNQKHIYKQYFPLAVSSILMATVEPVVQAAIARSPGSEVNLAVYPVVISLTWLSRVHLWNAQQIVIARVKTFAQYGDVRRFIFAIAAITTSLLALLMIPAMSRWIFGNLMGLEGPIRDMAIKGFPIAIAIPTLQAVRSFYYGTLISQERTGGIQVAAFVRIGVMILLLASGVSYGRLNGLYLALIATALGDLSECLILKLYIRRIVWTTPINRNASA